MFYPYICSFRLKFCLCISDCEWLLGFLFPVLQRRLHFLICGSQEIHETFCCDLCSHSVIVLTVKFTSILGVIHFLCSEWNTNLSDGPKFNFLLTEKQRRQGPNWTRDRELIYGLCKKSHSQSRMVLPANYIHYRWFISLLFTSQHFTAPAFIFHVFPMTSSYHSLISINYKCS